MGKVKIKKADVWIDMTPMSDVMVLLLTFFMLTSTFVKQEPVKVNTPGSVSEIKVPEKNVLNILVDKSGKIFMSMDNQNDLDAVLADVTGQYGISLNGTQTKKFKNDPMWGVPMNDLENYLNLPDQAAMTNALKKEGIPTDSVDGKMSEFQVWVKAAREATNDEIKVAIKADENTPYKVIKKMMSEMQDIDCNRYYLITQYKKAEDE